jgi:hypothetical protein
MHAYHRNSKYGSSRSWLAGTFASSRVSQSLHSWCEGAPLSYRSTQLTPSSPTLLHICSYQTEQTTFLRPSSPRFAKGTPRIRCRLNSLSSRRCSLRSSRRTCGKGDAKISNSPGFQTHFSPIACHFHGDTSRCPSITFVNALKSRILSNPSHHFRKFRNLSNPKGYVDANLAAGTFESACRRPRRFCRRSERR